MASFVQAHEVLSHLIACRCRILLRLRESISWPTGLRRMPQKHRPNAGDHGDGAYLAGRDYQTNPREFDGASCGRTAARHPIHPGTFLRKIQLYDNPAGPSSPKLFRHHHNGRQAARAQLSIPCPRSRRLSAFARAVGRSPLSAVRATSRPCAFARIPGGKTR